MEVSGQLHAPVALIPGKESLFPIGEEAEWAPEPVRTRWWRQKLTTSAGTQTLNHLSRSPALYHWPIPAPLCGVLSSKLFPFLASSTYPYYLPVVTSLISLPPMQLVPAIKRTEVNLTTHLHLMPTLRIRGIVPPLTLASSWRSV
jgi:hypothetical protein